MPGLSAKFASHEFISACEMGEQREHTIAGNDLPSCTEYILCSILGAALFLLGFFVAGLNDAWMSWSGILGIALMWLSSSILFGVCFSLSRANLHSVDVRPDSES